MATVGVRRVKERGGAGGKVMAAMPSSKPLTPLSDKANNLLSSSSMNRSTAKEKPRSVSRGPAVSQKPEIRAMPRMDKSSAVGSFGANAEARRRLSSSSVPRGRSSSPSDFSRVLSDMRRTRVSRVPVEQGGRVSVSDNRRLDSEMSSGRFGNGKGLSGFRGLERNGFRQSDLKASEKRVYGDRKENMKNGGKLVSECGKVPKEISVVDNKNDVKSSLNECKTDINGSAIRSYGNPDRSALDSPDDENKTEEDLNICQSVDPVEPSAKRPNVIVKSNGNPPDSQKVRPDLRSRVFGNNLKGVSISKEKEVSAVSGGGLVGEKQQTKLQEKLAFLEGKVKRIASDIKRTKEMLDMNNPDASKVIISDIQEKISGIEKAMSHVVDESGRKSSFSKNLDKDAKQAKGEGLIQNKQADDVKISVKGLNIDELEARLLPHQKLLKGRTSIKTSSSGSQSDKSAVPNCESSSANRPVTYPTDEDPIALEFLASLNQQPSKVSLNLCNDLEFSEVQETEDASESSMQQALNMSISKHNNEVALTIDAIPDEFDEQENKPMMIVEEYNEDDTTCQMREIGSKASTGGWFVSEGESVLLVHEDGSCSLHDIANTEEKSMYKPPSAISSNIWRDCWIVRAASADGCAGKYVVAASAGNTMESGFCSWDFYTKEVQAFHIEERTTNKRSILAPLQDTTAKRSNTLSATVPTENRQWWYKPLGPLVASTTSSQRSVQIYDVRDGERIMKWDAQKPVLMMDNSSPLQWRNRGKVVIAQADGLTVWDVGSLNAHALLSVSSSGHKISSLHVSNTDAEVGGGVRQRITSAEAEGHDGVFCTADSINILDFRQPSGIGLKIPKSNVTAQSIFSRGDSVLLGCNNVKPPGKTQFSHQVQQFSLRQQKMVSTYTLPDSNAYSSLNQVWCNSNLVMGICGQGLFVFDVSVDDGLQNVFQKPREVIGPDDLYAPSFDYASSQVLLISRDRPAMFRYL